MSEWNMANFIAQQVIENPPDDRPARFPEVLRSIVEGTAHLTGVEFFQSLVANLARAIDVQYAFIAEFTENRCNIRELENVMERSVILCSGERLIIDPHVLLGTLNATSNPMPRDDLAEGTQLKPEALGTKDSASTAVHLASGSLESIEKSHILSVLGQTNWRIEGEGGAAQILGLHPNTLRSRMKKLGITRPTN
jgi:transcriptional regulator of acetoin/glycerol metabolism